MLLRVGACFSIVRELLSSTRSGSTCYPYSAYILLRSASCKLVFVRFDRVLSYASNDNVDNSIMKSCRSFRFIVSYTHTVTDFLVGGTDSGLVRPLVEVTCIAMEEAVVRTISL